MCIFGNMPPPNQQLSHVTEIDSPDFYTAVLIAETYMFASITYMTKPDVWRCAQVAWIRICLHVWMVKHKECQRICGFYESLNCIWKYYYGQHRAITITPNSTEQNFLISTRKDSLKCCSFWNHFEININNNSTDIMIPTDFLSVTFQNVQAI